MEIFFYLRSICHNIYRCVCQKIAAFINARRSLTLLGLDINPTYVALAEIRRCCKHDSVTYELASFAFVPVTYHLDGYRHDDDAIQRAIAYALAKAKSRSNRAVAAIPYAAITLKKSKFSHILEENDMENFLALNSETYLGKEADLVNFDYQILPEVATDGNSSASAPLSLRVVSVDKEQVKKYLHLLEKASLQCKALDVDIYALVRAVVLLYPTIEFPCTLLQLDPERSVIAVFDGEEVIAVQDGFIDESAKRNDQVLVQYVLGEIRLAHSKIARPQVNVNIVPEQNLKPNVNLAPLPRLLSEENAKSYTNLQLNLNANDVSAGSKTVILCGTNQAVLHELQREVKEQLHVNAFIANPFSKIAIAAPLHHYSDYLYQIAPSMMLCCGLALHGSGSFFPASKKG